MGKGKSSGFSGGGTMYQVRPYGYQSGVAANGAFMVKPISSTERMVVKRDGVTDFATKEESAFLGYLSDAYNWHSASKKMGYTADGGVTGRAKSVAKENGGSVITFTGLSSSDRAAVKSIADENDWGFVSSKRNNATIIYNINKKKLTP